MLSPGWLEGFWGQEIVFYWVRLDGKFCSWIELKCCFDFIRAETLLTNYSRPFQLNPYYIDHLVSHHSLSLGCCPSVDFKSTFVLYLLGPKTHFDERSFFRAEDE